MPEILRRGFAVASLALVLMFLSTPAFAHAILLSTSPGVDQAVSGPNVPIQLRFNSRIDGKRSRLILVSADGGAGTPLTIKEQSSPDTLAAQAEGLKSGAYILRWQVLANDGHITRGEVSFRVQ